MMRATFRQFASLPSSARLIWLVVLALALQPLAWAQQPTAQWVTLPYCITSAAPAAHAAARPTDAARDHAHHLQVLLDPSAALNATGSPWALPAASPATAALSAHTAQPALPEPAAPRDTALRQRPQQPRAPPQVS
ncbi:MAG: transcriptional regulator algP [Thiomonas sp.]